MLLQKKNFEDFYNEIRDQLPEMRKLDTWDKYDWSVNGHENYKIMTELCREMATWVAQGEKSDVERLMTIIERYFNDGEEDVISIIYSDFLVTIMEAEKEVRETIMKMMGPQTKRHYQYLLKFYREGG